MIARAVLFFLLTFSYASLFAQTDTLHLKEKTDTLETIISDTSITYIIQAKPITIIEKIEIFKPKPKNQYYLSMTSSILYFKEFKKAQSSYEAFLSKLDQVTNNLPSYSIGASLAKCPKKVYSGISVSFIRLNQIFNYTSPLDEKIYSAKNHFNYLNIGIHGGYWFKKEKKISYILYGGIHGDNLLSYSSYTINNSNLTTIQKIKDVTDYKEFLLDFSIQLKLLYAFQNSYIEIEPYAMISPISATLKTEVYSIERLFLGIKIGLNNKIF